MSSQVVTERQPFPAGLRSSKELADTVLNNLSLNNDSLATPFALPPFSPTFANVAAFADLELKLQFELLREELYHKVCRVGNVPKPADEETNQKAEKHLQFQFLPHCYQPATQRLTLPSTQSVTNTPNRSQWSNYFVVLQTKSIVNGTMQDIAIAYCQQFRKNGVIFGWRLPTASITLRRGPSCLVVPWRREPFGRCISKRSKNWKRRRHNWKPLV